MLLRYLRVSLLVSSEKSNIIDFLFTNGLSINDIEAVEVDIPVNIMLLVNLIEDLPGNIIVDLLLHFLELFKGNLFFVFLVSALLVLPVNFSLKTFTNFFIFFDHTHPFI